MSKENLIKKIKRSIRKEDIDGLENLLSQVESVKDMRLINSNKIFIKILECDSLNLKFTKLTGTYLSSIEKFSSKDAVSQMMFIEVTMKVYEISKAINIVFTDIMKTSFNNSLSCFVVALSQWRYKSKQNLNFNNENLSRFMEARGKLIDFEFFVDYMFEIAYINLHNDLKEYDSKANAISWSKENYNEEIMNKIYGYAATYHSLYNLFDKISFGEYDVESLYIDEAKDCFNIRLQYVDKDFMKVKYAGLRQTVISQPDRPSLFEPIVDMIKESVYPLGKEQGLTINQIEKIVEIISSYLSFDIDKVLLSIESVYFQKALYILSLLAMLCFIESEKAKLSKCQLDKYYSVINSNIIKKYFADIEFISEEEFQQIFDGLFKNDNKLTIYSKLITLSLLCTEDGNCIYVHPIMLSLTGFYDPVFNYITQRYLKEKKSYSGKIVSQFGDKYNDFIMQIAEKNGFEILEIDYKIKEDHNVKTDVDIIIKYLDVLFLIQVKSVISSLDIYSHFKAKTRIEEGIEQANTSLEYINLNSNIYSVLFKKHKIKENEINEVVALVVTNNKLFNGWIKDNITVISAEQWNYFCTEAYKYSRSSELLNLIKRPIALHRHESELKIEIRKDNFFGMLEIEYETMQ